MSDERAGPPSELPGRPDRANQPERPREAGPRIYVADLAAYNHGILRGAWLDATADPDELGRQVLDLLANSPIPGSEEHAIHDYEGFFGLHLDDYESLEHISTIAQGILEHGDAYAALTGYLGSNQWDEDLGRFDDLYLGHWASTVEYAEDLLDDLGATEALEQLGDWLQPYVRLDAEAFARDLEVELYVAEAADGGVHLFEPL